MKRINRKGEKNGKLTNIGPAPSVGGHAYHHAQCECGQVVTVANSNRAKTLSCGCGREDYLLTDEWIDVVGTHGLLYAYGYIPPSLTVGQGAVRSSRKTGYWLCRCRGCNSWVKVSTSALKTGRTMACTACTPAFYENLWEQERLWITPAVKLTWTRNSFYSMRRRVRDKAPGYENGTVCPQWLGSGGFAQFLKDMGLRRHRGLSIERINGLKGYEPGNCMWADDPTQRRNKSTSRYFNVEGKKTNLVDFAATLGQKANLVSRKINRLLEAGFTEDEAVEQILAAQCAVNHNAPPTQLERLTA